MSINSLGRPVFLLAVLFIGNLTAQPDRVPASDLPGSSDYIFSKINERVPEFAGFWYEEDRVTIGLTRITPKSKADSAKFVMAALKLRQTAARIVKYKLAANSFSIIHTARNRIRSLLGDGMITFLDTDERSNVVLVGVRSQKDEADITAKIVALGINLNLVKIEPRKAFKTFESTDGQEVLRQRYRPLMGGIQIFRGHGGTCTLGVTGLLNGIRGIFTNSHCTRLQGILDPTIFLQGSGNAGDRIGQETADIPIFPATDDNDCPYGYRCSYGDVAFARLDDNVGAKRGWIKGTGTGTDHSGDYEINGYVMFGSCGMRVLKLGARTGKTYGEISHTCTDFWVGEGANRFYYLCQDVATYNSGKGDSGSPVITQTNTSKVQFYGLHFASGDDDAAITPFFLMAAALGAVDLLPGNDPPRIRITSPVHGGEFGMGTLKKIRLEASVFDPEGKNCGAPGNSCTITWSSNLDGNLGTGKSIEVGFTMPGTRSITATVNDGSHSAADQVALFVTSNPPMVDIISPGGALYKGIRYLLYAEARDSDVGLLERVDCNRFLWNSNRAEDRQTDLPKQSCMAIVTFKTLGDRILDVTATDKQGDKATKTLPVSVAPLPRSGPPIISILNRPGMSFNPNATGALQAMIVDPDGGGPSGQRLSYKWKVKYGDTEKIIGGKVVSNYSAIIYDPWRARDHVPNTCGGWPATLTLEATDAQGQKSSQSIRIYVQYPLC